LHGGQKSASDKAPAPSLRPGAVEVVEVVDFQQGEGRQAAIGDEDRAADSPELAGNCRLFPQMALAQPRYDPGMRLMSTPDSARQRAFLAVLFTALMGLGGCALVEDTAQSLLASRTSATAVAGGRLLEGQAVFNQARTGNLHLHSLDAPTLDCFGELRMTSTSGGVASLRCSDGQTAVVPFQLLGSLRAAGRGMMGEAVFSLTYGLPPEMSAPYLGVGIERLVRADPRPAQTPPPPPTAP